jgi:hypothetical protein
MNLTPILASGQSIRIFMHGALQEQILDCLNVILARLLLLFRESCFWSCKWERQDRYDETIHSAVKDILAR